MMILASFPLGVSMAKKYYAVAAGRKTGIFTDWASARKEVAGFAGAKFKGFSSEKEAKAWLQNPVYIKKGRTEQTSTVRHSPKNEITIYTDGGCLNNPGPGGYGAIIEDAGKYQKLSGGYRLTTNNRMEMMAAIVALKKVVEQGRPVTLFSDSSYLVNGIRKGWAKKWRRCGWKKSDNSQALNSDLWKELLNLIEGRAIQFHWIKGHAGNALNEQCDKLAAAAAKNNPEQIDTGYE